MHLTTRLDPTAARDLVQRRRRVTALRVEALGGLAAAVLASLVLAHLAASPRSWVLFFDGDSLLFPLITASLRVGQAQQWVLSSPLFLPEAAVYLPIGALGLPVQATLLADGVVNWLVLYGLVRMTASRTRAPRPTAVVTSVLVTAAISVLALCESSGSRDALEPASLLMTTTYYSGTVAAVLAAVAPAAGALHSRRVAGSHLGLCAIVAVGVASNPILIAWGIVPMVVVAVVTRLSGATGRAVLTVLTLLAVGTGLGLLARVPFAPMLVQDGTAKIRPDLAAASFEYYASLLGARLQTAAGVLELGVCATLLLAAAVGLPLAVRQRWITGTVLTGIAVAGPLLAVGGSIALGTFAARYLEPVVLLPPLVLLTVPRLLPHLAAELAALARQVALPLTVGIAVLAAAVTAISAGSLLSTSSRPDASVACAARWVAGHDQYGAGQYWTVRAVKAYTADPRRLIQTDADAAPYAWLSNTADLAQGTVTYTITDSASAPFDPALGDPLHRTPCGRYTIDEYAAPIVLGRPHH